MSDSPLIRIAELRKSYGDTKALDGISVDVHAGEIFGMIGPDGAGKTTAMRITCGLLLADSGTVHISGHDSAGETRAIKELIGYMPQRFSLYPDLTVAENLRFFADMHGVDTQMRLQREERLMKFSRLGPFRKRRAGKLSGGMKQKLALSCILIHVPEVLILDEPTTGVDPVSRQEFWQILKELAGEGKALLVSTPYMDEAQLCHRVALMHRGRVMTTGTPDEVTAQFDRRLMEVRGGDLNAARQALIQMETEGIDVNRFGDRLHVVYDTHDQRVALLKRIEGMDVTAEDAEPTIEDAFVQRMTAGK
jgi:ABC-2 type transport system ATP-binding protein